MAFSRVGKGRPNDKQLNIIFDVKKLNQGNCGKGQLSKKGYEQMAELSEVWEKLYPNLFLQNKLTVRSTIVERVRLSALA